MPRNGLIRTPFPESRARPAHPVAQRSLLAVMCACVGLVVGMVAAVNLAVPMLAASDLRPSASALIWIVDTYVICFACLVIPGGAAGDRFARKGVLLTGLALFAAGALLSAVAPTVPVLLAGRAITGVGAAAVLPNTLAILLHAVPAERKGATIAAWAAMTGIGGVVGNVGGGAVLASGSWRWLLVAASFALLLGIVDGPEAGWGSALVVTGFVSAAVLFAALTLVELKVEHPLLDPRLLRIPALRSACLGMTTVFFGMFALFYVNASFLQYGKGFGVLQTGLGIIPLTVPIILGARYVARLSQRIGLDATTALAFLFVGGGLLGLSTTGADTPYAVYAAWLVVTGIGVTLALPTLSGVIAGSLPAAQAGVGTGLQATTREFGSALGVAVIGTILTARFADALPADIRASHDPHTVAQALAATTPDRSSEVIGAFVTAADTGFRVIGLAVLMLGCLVVAQSLLSRPR
ncbi:MFS transporter [Nocardia crassostreae]|uniref:MFS transporter n=1 Tax=Nocardia crassostreae TaxID=53428 RepID=UPI00082B5179|nr:MFS transporter [Nocardia crassostreae]